MTKNLIIADDFGLCEKHDKVIINLIQKRKLNAVSVMVHSGLNNSRIGKITKVKHSLTIGLHLNLTILLPKFEATNTSKNLMIKNLIAGTENKVIELKIRNQINLFKELFGRFPDFIDGHEHVHVFPNILSTLLQILSTSPLPKNFWIRSPTPSTLKNFFIESKHAGIKVFIISILGLFARRKFRRLNIRTNANFSGFLKLTENSKYFELFYNENLKLFHEDSILMVHPGDVNSPVQLKGHSNKIRALEAKILINSAVFFQ